MNLNDHDNRLDEAAAYALGALDADQVEGFTAHLESCNRCQEQVHWLAPAVQALPEAVARQTPPPAVRDRLMAEVRSDAAAHAKQAQREERRVRDESRGGFSEWLRDLNFGGLTWKPLAGMAAAVLVIAVVVGYAVGNGGSDSSSGTSPVAVTPHTTEAPQPNGIVAKVVTEGNRAEIRLTGVKELPDGKVLEAWVQRGNAVERVPALFAPNHEGNASTTIDNIKNVSAVLVTREPNGGTKVPTTKPIVKVPLDS